MTQARHEQKHAWLLYSLANVPVAEQELAAQVALLDDVVIRDGHTAAAIRSNAHACEVLDKLAAKRASSDQEEVQTLQLLLQSRPEHTNLAIIAGALTAHKRAVSACVCRGYTHNDQPTDLSTSCHSFLPVLRRPHV